MLTPRETEVLYHLNQGKSSREVADIVLISKRTVDFHVANLHKKLGVRTRAAALQKAEELGLLAEAHPRA